MRVIAISNLKGGSGKTTTAVNLAAALAETGRKVMLVDLDAQASSSQWLSAPRDEEDRALVDAHLGNGELWDLLVETQIEDLHLLPSSFSMRQVNDAMPHTEGAYKVLAQHLKRVPAGYDYILFDCAPDLVPVTQAALVATREVLAPVETHFLALQGIVRITQTLDILKEEWNPKIRLCGILPCRVDARNRHCGEIIAMLRERFGPLVFQTEIRENVRLAESPSFQQSILQYDSSSNGAEDYRAAALELIEQE